MLPLFFTAYVTFSSPATAGAGYQAISLVYEIEGARWNATRKDLLYYQDLLRIKDCTQPGVTPRSSAYLDSELIVFISLCAGNWFNPVSEDCVSCPEGAVCPGGDRIWPSVGYWSPDEYTAPVRCALPDACPGAMGEC